MSSLANGSSRITVHAAGRTSWRGVVQLVRPGNVLMFLAGVAVGGVLAKGGAVWSALDVVQLLLAAVSAACIGAAGNAINDVFDLDIDRVNRPNRPLPSGRVSISTAKRVWMVGSALGVGLALLLGAVHAVIAVAAVGVLWAYSARLKEVALVGNVAVALVIGLALVYGGLAVGAPVRALVGGAFAFLTTLAREVVKDVEDVRGDAAGGARTLPLRIGTANAVGVAVALLLGTVAATPLPYLWLDFGPLYLIAVGLTAGVLLASAWALLREADAVRGAALASARLKGGMLLGLLALAVA